MDNPNPHISPTPESPTDKKSDIKRILKGNAFILVATIFFGVNIPVVKDLIPKWLSAFDVTAFRLIGGCALMWLASLFVRNDKILRSDVVKIITAGVVGLFGFITLFNWALKYGNPIDISIIMTFPPLFVVIIEILFKHHHASKLEILGILISLAGAIVVVISGASEKGSDHNLLGDLLAALSSICYSLYLVILEKPSATYKPLTLMRWTFLCAAIPSIPFAFAVPHSGLFTHGEVGPALLLAFVVVCPSFLSYLMMSPAIKLIGSELVSLYQYLVPVIATIASVLMGLATLRWLQVLAMVIIVVGMLMTDREKRKQHKLGIQ